MVNLVAYEFSNQKTQVKWRVRPHVNSRTKPPARFTPNNRSHERLFGKRVQAEPFRSFTCGPTHQKSAFLGSRAHMRAFSPCRSMSEEREEDGFREPPDAARCVRAGKPRGLRAFSPIGATRAGGALRLCHRRRCRPALFSKKARKRIDAVCDSV